LVLEVNTSKIIMNFIRAAFFSAIIAILGIGDAFAQGVGSIGGSVTDPRDAIVPGAIVTAIAADGTTKTGRRQ